MDITVRDLMWRSLFFFSFDWNYGGIESPTKLYDLVGDIDCLLNFLKNFEEINENMNNRYGFHEL